MGKRLKGVDTSTPRHSNWRQDASIDNSLEESPIGQLMCQGDQRNDSVGYEENEGVAKTQLSNELEVTSITPPKALSSSAEMRSFAALTHNWMAVDNISDEVVEKLIIERAVPREMVSEPKGKCPNSVQDEKVSAPEVSTAPETVQFTNEKTKVNGSKSVSVEGISSSNPLRKYLIGKRRGGISPSGNSVTKLGASASAEVLNLPVKPGTGTKRNLQESPSNPSTPSRRRNTNTDQLASPALRKGKKECY